MTVKIVINSNENSTIIATERSLFGRLLTLTKSRQSPSPEFVLSFSLSPITWSIGLPDSGIVKT